MPTTTPSGLRYEEIAHGDPNGETAEIGHTVLVHYTGWLSEGTKFDSSRDRDEPLQFTLGTGEVVAGWDEGIQGMQVGAVRKLTVPASLAYGADGIDGIIPPNAELVFEVALLEA